MDPWQIAITAAAALEAIGLLALAVDELDKQEVADDGA